MGVKGKNRQQIELIVCDTGPILHLMEAEILQLLHNLGDIRIPQTVSAEMEEFYPHWEISKPRWVVVEPLLPDEAIQAERLVLSGLLDSGEAEAVTLAKRLKPKWFLTDDAEARIFANSLGMEVHGSLGIVLWSAATGHLNYPESKAALEKLSSTSLWISKEILVQAKEALNEIFG